MSESYQIRNQHALHFLTLQVVHWADVFTRKNYRDIVIESFKYCKQNKGLEIFAYVIMSNHIHLLCRSINADLSDILRDLNDIQVKKFLKQ